MQKSNAWKLCASGCGESEWGRDGKGPSSFDYRPHGNELRPLSSRPGLRDSGFDLKSPQDDLYNCIAWAAGSTHTKLWWWPFGEPEKTFCPASVPRQETLDAFRQLFATLGYSVCGHANVEPGYEKIALFADAHRFPLHAARQLAGGRWPSKRGALEDIDHALQDLVGSEYGSVALMMKRPWASYGEKSESPDVP